MKKKRPEVCFKSWQDFVGDDKIGDKQKASESEADDILFGFAAIIALGGAMFFAVYCSFHFFGIANKIFCGACGIGGIVLSLVLWAACCQTFEQVKKTVVVQAFLSIIFIVGVLL
jgi:hypothetical protein